MNELVNLLSKAEIPLFYARRLKMYNMKHVLYWDYDNKEINLDQLQALVDELGLEFHLIKTIHGYHLIDFHLFDIFEIEGIQRRLNQLLPSTYPTIKKVEELDATDRQIFEGQTLRITKKSKDEEDLVYFTCIKCSDDEKLLTRPYSEGHQYIYKLVTDIDIKIKGLPVKTRVNVCSYLNKIPGVLN